MHGSRWRREETRPVGQHLPHSPRRLSPTLLAAFGDAPLVGPGSELQLTIDGRAAWHEEVIAELHAVSRAGARGTRAVDVGGATSAPGYNSIRPHSCAPLAQTLR